MKCEKARTLMLGSLYGEISPRKQKALERHLASCAGCSQEFAGQKATVSTFCGLDFEAAPDKLNEIVREMAVRELEQEVLLSKKKHVNYWKPAFASAAAAILLVVGLIYYLPQARMDKQIAESAAPAVVYEADKAIVGETVAKDAEENIAGLSGGAQPESRDYSLRSESEQSDLRAHSSLKIEQEPAFRQKAAAPSSVDEGADMDAGTDRSPFSIQAPMKEKSLAESTPTESQALLFGEERENLKKRQDLQAPAAARGLSSYREEEASANELFGKGNEFFGKMDYAQAIGMYQDAITLAPESRLAVDARFRLGQAYQELKQFESALSEYQAITAGHPDYPALGAVYIAAGDCHMALGQPVEAARAYETVRDHFPEFRALALAKLAAIEADSHASGQE
jgi:TolA-binding protein